MGKKGVILFEGADEKHFLYHFIDNKIGINIYDYISYPEPEIQGIEELLQDLPAFIMDSKRLPIGVIIDANTSLYDRWKSIHNILKKADYSNIPPKPLANGTFITDKSPILPDIGIWIMPDNKSEGILEDFIKLLIPEDDLKETAKQTVQNLIDKNIHLFTANHKPKAEVHTWLAWQEEPGTPMGQAVTKQYLKINNEIANKFVTWLNKLFDLENIK